MNNTISFDPKFLSEKVKKDYSDHMSAIIREFLQNSVDAGATRVDFEFNEDERTLSVMDNGCGMDPEIMEKALFKIGGTHKSANSVGGFGSAKLILLFQHESFEIITRKDGLQHEVHGEGSSYSDYVTTETDLSNGTLVNIKFSDSWSKNNHYDGTEYDEYYAFEEKAKKVLSHCEVSALVYWNGSQVANEFSGDIVRELDWCKIYMRKATLNNYAHIRIKGIQMFPVYISQMEQYITIELTSDSSLNILTTNRDGLKYTYKKELDAIIGELTVDKNSFANKKGDLVRYAGKTKSTYEIFADSLNKFKSIMLKKLCLKREQAKERNDDNKIQEINNEINKVNGIDGKEEIQTVTKSQTVSEDAIANFVESIKIKNKLNGLDGIELEDMIQEEILSATEHDFIVEYDKNMNSLPDNINPEKGIIKKYANIAKLYRYSISYILCQLNKSANIKIGWIISDHAEAKYIRQEDQVYFLINPHKCVPQGIAKKLKVKRIFRLALHEVTHFLGYDYHDESFMNRFTELLDIQDEVQNWTEFEKEACKEKL